MAFFRNSLTPALVSNWIENASSMLIILVSTTRRTIAKH
nr:MAG TPA: hypothetical protein [Caudoviricetes sp.]